MDHITTMEGPFVTRKTRESTTTATTNTMSFPWNVIIITCPDEAAAKSVPCDWIRSMLLERYFSSTAQSDTTIDAAQDIFLLISATCDPYGTKCGSGGGTLAAMDHVVELLEQQQQQQPTLSSSNTTLSLATCTTLILHAGGESSRSPTQMIVGKAWTSLPLVLQETNANPNEYIGSNKSTNHNGLEYVSNPTIVLIHELTEMVIQHQQQQKQSLSSSLSWNIVPGTVVVAATDTVVSLTQYKRKQKHRQKQTEQVSHSIRDMQSTKTMTMIKNTSTMENEPAVEKHPSNDNDGTKILSQGGVDGAAVCDNNHHDTSTATCSPAVIGIAVPAVLETAKNHGVYLLPQAHFDCTNKTLSTSTSSDMDCTMMRLVPPCQVLQKPSLEELKQIHDINNIACTHEYSNPPPCNRDDNDCQQQESASPDSKPTTSSLQPTAWIDTGIIIFLPRAVQILQELSQRPNGFLEKCTKRGLQRLYDAQLQSNKNSTNNSNYDENCSMIEFARHHVTKLDLYTDVLQCLSYPKNNESATTAATTTSTKVPSKSPCSMVSQLQNTKAWTSLPLHVLAIPCGSFVHLGTTQEWVDFVTSHVHSSSVQTMSKFPCQSRHSCWTHPTVITTTATGNACSSKLNPNVVLNSILYANKYLQIGHGSIIEHCRFPIKSNDHNEKQDKWMAEEYDTIQIGSNCVVSGIRYPKKTVIPTSNTDASVNESSQESLRTLNIPNDLCIQMIALKKEYGMDNVCSYPTLIKSNDPNKFVCMVLGMSDKIEKSSPCTQLYNRPLSELLPLWNVQSLGSLEELASTLPHKSLSLSPSSSMPSLWHARIHPIVDATTPLESVFGWLFAHLSKTDSSPFGKGTKIAYECSLALYKSLPKVSLFDLHSCADASLEWDFRKQIFQCLRTKLSKRIIDHPAEFATYIEYWNALLSNTGTKTAGSTSDPQASNAWSWINLAEQIMPTDPRKDKNQVTSNESKPDSFSVLDHYHKLIPFLEALHYVVGTRFQSGAFPICGRAFWVASSILSELSSSTSTDGQDEDNDTRTRSLQDWSEHFLWLSSTEDQYIEMMRFLQKFIVESLSRPCDSAGTKEEHLLKRLHNCSETYERLACCMTEQCVVGHPRHLALQQIQQLHQKTGSVNSVLLDQWVIATAPVRVDLAGGWSDTPPICYEFFGGAVTGLAVHVDQYKPLSCRCRIVPGERGLFLRSESINPRNLDERHHQTVHVLDASSSSALDQLRDFRNPRSKCALLKCALVCMGFLSVELMTSQASSTEISTERSGQNMNGSTEQSMLSSQQAQCIQPPLNKFIINHMGGEQKLEDQDYRLEIITTSLLPQGSGMGTSSILGGCILAALSMILGKTNTESETPDSSMSKDENDMKRDDRNSNNNCQHNSLIQSVLTLEQLLTSGGGYQDQVNGLIGGAKIVTSRPNEYMPVVLSVQQVHLSPEVRSTFDQRLVLAYMGTTRLAKNILQNVLRQWATQTPGIVETVKNLVSSAHAVREAMETGDVDRVGEFLSTYWKHKKIMAGECLTLNNEGENETPVEPPIVRFLIRELLDRKLILGASLCGAGGGGFLVVVTAAGIRKGTLETLVQEEWLGDSSDGTGAHPYSSELSLVTWHDCTICMEGLSTRTLEPMNSEERKGKTKGNDHDTDGYPFDIKWHLPLNGRNRTDGKDFKQ